MVCHGAEWPWGASWRAHGQETKATEDIREFKSTAYQNSESSKNMKSVMSSMKSDMVKTDHIVQ